MDFQIILQQLVNALALGSIYALIALGYTMVYGIVKLINFAHGDVLMIGAYVGYFVLTFFGSFLANFGWPLQIIIVLLAIIVSIVVCSLIGMFIEKTCYKPLRNAPRMNALITAIGVSIVLENGMRALPFIGPNPRQFPVPPFLQASPNDLPIFSVISKPAAAVIIVSIILMAILFFVVEKTKIGKAMRAVSQDNKAALLMGISVDKVIAFTFALGAALAAVAGVMSSMSYPQVEPYMGIVPGLKAFIAAVLGGIGSIPGAVLGGIVLGLAETITKGFISSQLADGVSFGILILILVFRPTGLLGKNISEKV